MMPSTLGKMLSTRPGQWRVMLRTQWLLLRTRGQLKRLGLKRLLSGIDLGEGVAHASGKDQLEQAREMARLVNISARRGFIRGACLQRSLVLYQLLAEAGIAAELKIGPGQDSADFNAHAWVEVDGIPVNDREDIASRFPPFDQG